MKLHGAIFVVTGGSAGIGEAVVRMAVNSGCKAAIWDTNEERGHAMVVEFGDQVIFVQVDVTQEQSVDRGLARTLEVFGRIDCCVNCAGIALMMPTITEEMQPHSIEQFSRVLHVNLVGTFLCGSRCAAQMARQDPNSEGERGLVINIASTAALDTPGHFVAYSVSKAGVVGLTLPMARDLGKFGIRVNTICPGLTSTNMTGNPSENLDAATVPWPMRDWFRSQVFPTDRFGRASEVAQVVKFMAETTFLNGESVRIDGGSRAAKL